MNRSLSALSVLWIAFQISACDSPTRPEETPARLSITSVEGLSPGGTAVLRGSALQGLQSLQVDGMTASFQVVSDNEVHVQVPTAQACDVDGRSVDLVANGTYRKSGRLELSSTVRLAVGESRILSVQELLCLQFPARREGYVLSLHNHAEGEGAERVFSFRTIADSSFLAQASRAGTKDLSLLEDSHHPAPGFPSALAAGLGNDNAGAVFSAAPTPEDAFDPTYATANVGERIRLVDWWNTGAYLQDPAAVYEAVVVAVEGGQLVAVDARLANHAEFLTPAVREKYVQAARIAERYMQPAIRAVINPAYEPLGGAGGRTLTILRDFRDFGGPAAGTISNSDLRPKSVPGAQWSSGAPVLYLDVRTRDLAPGEIAGVAIHEAAHVADIQPHWWGEGGRSAGWYMEAVADAVVETATRMALGTETEADFSRVDAQTMPRSTKFSFPSMAPTPLEQGLSRYTFGAKILLYVRERMGQAGFQPTGTLLHQRLSEQSRHVSARDDATLRTYWSVEKVAAAIGMSREELLEQVALADLTDDRLDREAARRAGLPQFESWKNEARIPHTGEHILPRQGGVSGTASVPAGVFNYWYVRDDSEAGVTLKAEDIKIPAHVWVRLTRLR